MNIPWLAAVPAFILVGVCIWLVAGAIKTRHTAPRPTHRLVIGMMFGALSVNALVAGFGILGYIEEQGVITFWSALARTLAIVCGSYIAWHWWTDT